jgi:DNA-binding PadR family transcriptional regulator
MSTRSDNARVELLQGTLDLLILRTLVLGPVHRLMKRNLVSAEDGISENNRKARFYRLTAKGRKQLAVEMTKWEKLARAIGQILQPNG